MNAITSNVTQSQPKKVFKSSEAAREYQKKYYHSKKNDPIFKAKRKADNAKNYDMFCFKKFEEYFKDSDFEAYNY